MRALYARWDEFMSARALRLAVALEPSLCSLPLRLLALVRSLDHQGLAAFLHCQVPITFVAACIRASRRLAPALFTSEGRQDTVLSVVMGTGVGIGQPQDMS